MVGNFYKGSTSKNIMVKFRFKLLKSGSLDDRDATTKKVIEKLKKLSLPDRNSAMQSIAKAFGESKRRR